MVGNIPKMVNLPGARGVRHASDYAPSEFPATAGDHKMLMISRVPECVYFHNKLDLFHTYAQEIAGGVYVLFDGGRDVVALLMQVDGPEAQRVQDAVSFGAPIMVRGVFGETVLLNNRHCANCYTVKEGSKLQRCGNCRGAVYCSERCQKEDWIAGGHILRCEGTEYIPRSSPAFIGVTSACVMIWDCTPCGQHAFTCGHDVRMEDYCVFLRKDESRPCTCSWKMPPHPAFVLSTEARFNIARARDLISARYH